MKRPGFLHGVVAAAVLAFFAAAFVAVITPFVGTGVVARILIPALALAYVLYLFSRTAEKTGRVTTLALWSAMTLLLWWFALPLPLYLLAHAAAVWLIRSLYFYAGVVPSLMDMALTGLSIVTAVWALSRTGSVFLGTWCFFLVQALFTAIPHSLATRVESSKSTVNDDFERSRRRAEAALHQLFTR